MYCLWNSRQHFSVQSNQISLTDSHDAAVWRSLCIFSSLWIFSFTLAVSRMFVDSTDTLETKSKTFHVLARRSKVRMMTFPSEYPPAIPRWMWKSPLTPRSPSGRRTRMELSANLRLRSQATILPPQRRRFRWTARTRRTSFWCACWLRRIGREVCITITGNRRPPLTWRLNMLTTWFCREIWRCWSSTTTLAAAALSWTTWRPICCSWPMSTSSATSLSGPVRQLSVTVPFLRGSIWKNASDDAFSPYNPMKLCTQSWFMRKLRSKTYPLLCY